MYNLFLDDIRSPHSVYKHFDGNWVIARDYEEFKSIIEERGVPSFISFDHDLGAKAYIGLYGTEKNGYDCALWLEKKGFCPSAYKVHSMNPVGAQRIKDVMERISSK